jgi:hypothetical protein
MRKRIPIFARWPRVEFMICTTIRQLPYATVDSLEVARLVADRFSVATKSPTPASREPK